MIELLTEGLLHPKIMLISRLVEFYRSQLESPKFCIRFLVRQVAYDLRTKLGRTLHRVASELNVNVEQLNGNLVKSKMKYAAVPVDESWRSPLALELMKIRNGDADIAGFTNDEVETMLSFVCCA